MRVQGSGEEGAAAARLLRFPWSTADPSRLSGGGQRFWLAFSLLLRVQDNAERNDKAYLQGP